MKELTASVAWKKYTKASAIAEIKHVTREANDGNKNIDPTRTANNKQYVGTSSADTLDFIDEHWADIMEEHDKTRQNREKWGSFVEHADTLKGRNAEVFHEFVLEYGSAFDMRKDKSAAFLGSSENNLDNLDIDGEEWTRRVNALDAVAEELPHLFPSFQFFNITLHVDEDAPHIHAMYTVQHTSEKLKTRDFSTSTSKVWAYTLEQNGRTPHKNKQGGPFPAKDMAEVLHEVLPDKMIDIYNKANQTNVKRETNTKKRRKVGLKLDNFKKIAEALSDSGRQLFLLIQQVRDEKRTLENEKRRVEELIEELQNKIETVDTLAQYLDDEKTAAVDELVENIDIDALIQKANNNTEQSDEIEKQAEQILQELKLDGLKL